MGSTPASSLLLGLRKRRQGTLASAVGAGATAPPPLADPEEGAGDPAKGSPSTWPTAPATGSGQTGQSGQPAPTRATSAGGLGQGRAETQGKEKKH